MLELCLCEAPVVGFTQWIICANSVSVLASIIGSSPRMRKQCFHFSDMVMSLYLEEVEGVGDPELHLLAIHSWRIVNVELHQVLRLIHGSQLHKRLQGLQQIVALSGPGEKHC